MGWICPRTKTSRHEQVRSTPVCRMAAFTVMSFGPGTCCTLQTMDRRGYGALAHARHRQCKENGPVIQLSKEFQTPLVSNRLVPKDVEIVIIRAHFEKCIVWTVPLSRTSSTMYSRPPAQAALAAHPLSDPRGIGLGASPRYDLASARAAIYHEPGIDTGV
jgi:hypothetical protein